MTPNFDYKEGRGDYYRGEGIREERERVTPQPDTRLFAEELTELLEACEARETYERERADQAEAALTGCRETLKAAEARLEAYQPEAALSFIQDELSAGDNQ